MHEREINEAELLDELEQMVRDGLLIKRQNSDGTFSYTLTPVGTAYAITNSLASR